MLTKVDRLAHIGRFQTLQHKAEGFKQLALVFARNGFGKSTVCAVLRSAAMQDPRLIAERAHLGPPGVPSATLQFDPQGTVAFNNGSWNRTPPPLLLFDQEYVKANVHVAEEVTKDNKRGLLQVILGATGVSLARQLADLDAENARNNACIRDLEGAIRKAAPGVDDVAAYIEAIIPTDIDQRIAVARRTVEQAKRRGEISRRPQFTPASLGGEPQNYLSLLKEGLGGRLSEASARVEEHLSKHALGEQGRRWLSYGVDHVNGEDCPFCDQEMLHSQTIISYKILFGDEYKALAGQLEIAEKFASLALVGPTAIVAIMDQNEASFDFWASVADLQPLPNFDQSERRQLLDTISWMAACLKIKAANPGVPLDVPVERAFAWQAALSKIAAYDAVLAECNKAIKSLKEDNSTPLLGDAERAEAVLSKWLALRERDAGNLKKLCAEWSAKYARRTAIASERASRQEALRQHTLSMASAYEAGINEILDSFGVNFQFCQAKANYVGGANVQYCVDINGYALPVGESGAGEKPSFRTVLSSGDKMSLALALFITQVKQRQDISELTLVFDDPFTSQDAGRQFETAARIRAMAADARQAIVLSHDPRFLHLIKKDAAPIEYSEHQIGLDANWRGRVCSWSSEEELKTDYVRRAERIRGLASTGQHLPGCSASLLAYDLRVFVEEYLDLRFPGRFPARTLLGGMIDEIDASPDDPLYPERRALREINQFARVDHHRGTSEPDPNQLRAQCKKVMRIVGRY